MAQLHIISRECSCIFTLCSVSLTIRLMGQIQISLTPKRGQRRNDYAASISNLSSFRLIVYRKKNSSTVAYRFDYSSLLPNTLGDNF